MPPKASINSTPSSIDAHRLVRFAALTGKETEAVEALFGVSYTAKFMVKKSETAIDYSVMPLEGLWWTDNMADFSIRKGHESPVVRPGIIENIDNRCELSPVTAHVQRPNGQPVD